MLAHSPNTDFREPDGCIVGGIGSTDPSAARSASTGHTHATSWTERCPPRGDIGKPRASAHFDPRSARVAPKRSGTTQRPALAGEPCLERSSFPLRQGPGVCRGAGYHTLEHTGREMVLAILRA